MKLRVCDIVFFVLLMLMTLAVGVFLWPALFSRRASQILSQQWAQAALYLLRKTSGIQSHIRGYQHISKTPVIYAVKHQSAWDTFMLRAMFGDATFVLKRQLYFIPVFGWFLWRTGNIGIDRKDGKNAMNEIITQSQKYVAEGRSIIIFPEGTRTQVGADTRYKMGITRLSEALQIPVVPVALNSGKYWPKSLLKKRSGNAVIEFLPAMPPAGSAKDAWLDDLKQRIETATVKLLEQA